MYTFWITVIGYSVIMLILVYTYQFQNFPKYWNYLGINEQLQVFPFIAHRYYIISCPLIVIIIFSVDKWISAWKYMKRKISL